MKRSTQVAKYVIVDFLAASAVWLLFNVLRYHEVATYLGFSSLYNYLTSANVWEGQLLIPLFWLVLYYFSGYYNNPFGKSRLGELFTTIVSVLVGVVLLFFVMLLNDLPRSIHIYYQLFFSLLGMQFAFTYIPRVIITQRMLNRVERGEWKLNVLVIGAGEKARQIAAGLERLHYRIAGFIPEDGSAPVAVPQEKVLGTLGDLPQRIASEKADELVVALESAEGDRMTGILYPLYKYKMPIKVLADKANMLLKTKVKAIRDIPLVDVTDNNFSEMAKNIKWLMDKTVSILFMILFSPLYLYVMIRVKRDSPGPVVFRQERIGYMGKPFMMYKFRTMYEGAEKDVPLLATLDDDRITPFGHYMRKYRLDELPQFWNVLKGDMSLVGPRPERKYFIDRIVKKAPYYYLLHNVRPGITSWGMVKYGYAGDVGKMIERLEYDMLYYENMSLILDLTILIYTVKTVVTGKGI